MGFDPSPESADPKLKAALRALHRRQLRRAQAGGRYFDSINPANETETRRDRARAVPADVDAAYAAAKRAYDSVLGQDARPRARQVSLPHRAASCRSVARELAVAETLDGGKPIKESRDVDLPLAAAHFFYHAGWADKLDYVAPGREAAPARRRRPGHPVEFPAAHAARGRSRPRSRAATPSCSSRPRPRRSRR